MLEDFFEIPILPGSSFMSVTDNGINFNKNVVKRMQGAEQVRLLCNPKAKRIAIQECDKKHENSIPFCRDEKNLTNGVRFNNREVVQMIATIMDWNLQEFTYRVDGFFVQDEQMMLFNLNSARKFSKKKQVERKLEENA